ncbi:ImmA/IrrE family metallo-endopeptidase [Patulibacter medicamentivorans]|uniref:ImmA/IrrE family metallo-endopeptidase n=1 Tax=Patulibacter medicamentivorans TaxID=1097667 RepID=UPI001110B43C|nr:ImmA/IrrE family metallo-endopeptidase [Patulibacter medicamentivorans]
MAASLSSVDEEGRPRDSIGGWPVDSYGAVALGYAGMRAAVRSGDRELLERSIGAVMVSVRHRHATPFDPWLASKALVWGQQHIADDPSWRAVRWPITSYLANPFWRNQTPYVFLNTMKSAEHARMDAAHELSHLVMHFWSTAGNPDSDDADAQRREDARQAEDDAKRFASAFLMPERSVLASAPRFPSVSAIVEAKRRWNVSAVALAYRMRTVGLLSEWHARTLMIEMSKLGYRTNEPNKIPRETSQLLAKVLGALRQQGVATVDISRNLNTPVEELNHIMFGLVLTRVPGGGHSSGPDEGPKLSVVPD